MIPRLIFVVSLLLLIINCGIVRCDEDEWDFAQDLRMFTPSPSTSLGSNNGNRKAKTLRNLYMKLEFQALGLKFSMDVEYNSNLVGAVLARNVTAKAVVGKNMKVTKEDGTADLVEAPLARFMVKKDHKGKVELSGGFQYLNQIYRIESSGSATLNPTIAKKAESNTRSLGIPSADSKMIVTRRSVGQKRGRYGETHRCGTEKLNFNKNQRGKPAEMRASKAHSKAPSKVYSKSRAMHNHKSKLDRLQSSEKGVMELSTRNSGCPATTHQLNIAVVADCNYVRTLGGAEKARDNILTDINLVSGIFSKTYNIDLSVISVETLEKCDRKDSDSFNIECKDYPGIDEALNRFSKWRDGKDGDAGIYHLVTSCNYSETVGLAWVNQVCRTTSFTDSLADVISGTSMTVLVDNQFSVIAHELAHNLGAIHDCTAGNCDGSCTNYLQCQCCACDDCDCKGKYIMEPESGGTDATEFSPCTVDDVCSKLPYIGHCIREESKIKEDLISVCGNGIREGDEECDCGDEATCEETSCCTKECKLTPGSRCYEGNDGCCQDCQIIPSSKRKVCRAAENECEEDSICSGLEKSCPDNPFKQEGKVCGLLLEGRGEQDKKCASGVCTSRNTQCSIFGRHLNITESCPYTKKSCSMICQGQEEQCVDMNANFIDGTPCGYNGFCSAGICSDFNSNASPTPKNIPLPWSMLVVRAFVSGTAFLAALF